MTKHMYQTIVLFFLSSCCGDGTDRSRHFNDFNITSEFLVPEGTPDLYPDQISVSLLTTEGEVIEQDVSQYTDTNISLNTMTFFFLEDLSDGDVESLRFQISGYQPLEYDFSEIPSEKFQLPPIVLASAINSNGLFCQFNRAMGNLLIPKAIAFSCPTKEGSMITYREGIKIEVDLTGLAAQ